jgi:hypothetical protein
MFDSRYYGIFTSIIYKSTWTLGRFLNRVLALGESNDSFGVVTRRQAREIIKK